jgi:hypothetical protein
MVSPFVLRNSLKYNIDRYIFQEVAHG